MLVYNELEPPVKQWVLRLDSATVFRINNQMKYLIIPYIALGLVLSLAIGIEYNCEGHEMFPIYYGCPFVFMKKSLGSSMEYYYSISGLL